MAKIIVLGAYAQFLINFRGHLLREMVKAGHEVIASAPEHDPDVKEALLQLGVDYLPVSVDRAGINILSDLNSIISLIKKFKKIKPDVVLVYNIKPVIYGSIAARLANVPCSFSIITGLGYGFIGTGIKGRLVGFIVRILYRFSIRYNSRIFFQNPDDRALFIRRGIISAPDKAVLINGSGVDTEHFQSSSLPSSISFLLIARLLGDKGVREYIDAARIIKKKYPELIFRLVGWIDVNPSAITQVELDAWIAEDIVQYSGRLTDVRPAISNASIYVLPSYREGTPRTVLEAMAMGRPIITTDAPGCRETVVDGDNGFLVPVKDAKALAEAMEKFILNPDLIRKMGKRSREIAEEKYDVHKVNKVIMKEMGLLDENPR